MKIDILVKFCTFILANIWKGCKWVRRSKILLRVHINMVYLDPVWELQNFYMGSQEQERCTFLGLKDKNALFGWVTPFLHTEPSLYDCRKVQRSQIFKQNLIISLHLSFIAFVVIWGLPGSYGCGGGWGWVWMCLDVPLTCPHMHTDVCMHTHMHNTKIY